MSLYVCVSYVACVSYTAKVACTICISLFANVGSRFFPRHFINRSYLSIYIYLVCMCMYIHADIVACIFISADVACTICFLSCQCGR